MFYEGRSLSAQNVRIFALRSENIFMNGSKTATVVSLFMQSQTSTFDRVLDIWETASSRFDKARRGREVFS